MTERVHGNLHIGQDADVLAGRRAAIVDLPWAWVRQVHGAEVVSITVANRGDRSGTAADALVTAEPGVVLAIHTADCAPVLFESADGVIGAAHAGWRGIEAGVLQETVAAMVRLGAHDIAAEVGPCVQAGCYEFGAADLDRLATTIGPTVRGTTSWGTPALDVPAAVAAILSGLPEVTTFDLGTGSCTACGVDAQGRHRWFSHRARAETERQASLIWIEPGTEPGTEPGSKP